MSKYLVTGAAGFIGSCLARNLLEIGNEVVTIDNLSTGFQDTIPAGVEFIKGNCQDEEVLEQLRQHKFDSIFHIAGQSSGEISYDNPVYDLQTNAQSTLQLLKYACESDCKNFVYASTMSVYGEQKDIDVNEGVSTNPSSFYGVGKLASEHYLRLYQEQFGIKTSALRLFNVYGPGQNMLNLRQGMVSIYLAQAIKNKSVHVKGDKNRFRDFVFIDDVVSACMKAESREDKDYLCCNIATGVKTRVEDLIFEICERLPYDVAVEYSGSTPGDLFGIYANIELAVTRLNWKAEVSLSEGLDKMISWALSN